MINFSQLDLFLEQHAVGPGIFHIGIHTPIAIKDQIIRGLMLIDRLWSIRYLDVSKTLLIVGGGLGGVTAGLRAATKYRIKTCICEASIRPFKPQRVCPTRYIDPVQYDWPMQHWDKGRYPWKNPEMPLSIVSGFSNELAADWLNTLSKAQEDLGRDLLEIRNETEVVYLEPYSITGSKVRAIFHRKDPEYFDAAVVSAIGREKTTIDNYQGFGFWDKDPYGTDLPSTASVVISGSGDGALQDFLRVVTQAKIAKELYKSLESAIPSSVTDRIHSLEEEAQRDYAWLTSQSHKRELCLVANRLHKGLLPLAARLAESDAVQKELRKALLKKLPKVLMIYACTHFSKAYPLNRFLVLLIAEFAVLRGLPIRLLPKRKITKITGDGGHECQMDPDSCHLRRHRVELSEQKNCQEKPTETNQIEVADVIILRHGIEDPPVEFPDDFPLRRHQLLPYHILDYDDASRF